MTYWGEFRAHWRFLLAAGIGLAAGYSITNYINNIFTPQLISEFGWSKSDLALVGVTAVLAILCQPIAGRLTDAFGVRRMALVGVLSAPLVFLGLSMMNGPLSQFFLLSFIQVVIVGGTTSATIYSRLIAQQFNRARGMALALAACGPAVVGAICVPFLSQLIDTSGWRAGYVAVAVGTAVLGILALLLIPAGSDFRPRVAVIASEPSRGYRAIVRNPAFILIIVGMILCNLSFTLQTSQLKVLLLDRGVDSETGSLAISLFAASVIGGRLFCGLALDRWPTHIVSALSLGAPGLGLGILASGVSSPLLIAAAVVLLGLSMGAEGDVLAYLVMRFFQLEIYSTVLGLVIGAIALSITLGSLLLSFTLKATGSFTPFLVIAAASTFIGGVVFMMLRRVPTVQ